MSAFIPPEVLEELRARNDIVAVIETFFPLRRQGTTLKALCPFHKEKTPSFTVNPQRQIFHCFGCGKGGDVFRFVMEYEKLDFPAAVQWLARRAGMRLEYKAADAPRASQREKLLEINQAAAEFYHRYLLKNEQAAPARQYLRQRGLDKKAAVEFMLGYAPEQWDGLLRWAQDKYAPELLEQAGLVLPSSSATDRGRWYDRFRARLIFPIRDEQGRIVGFSGRVIKTDEAGAKYVNTPETLLFHKGRILYALDRARRAMAETRQAVICEGQIDVIQCHLAGFTNAVAAQGTAFTDEHARILQRYVDNVVLLFDADSAGANAALRAGEIFLEFGLAVRVAAMPAGEDPDSLLRQPDGKAKMEQILASARSLIAFQMEVLRRNADRAASPETELLRQSRAVLALISRSPSAVQQTAMLKEAAAALGTPEDVLRHDMRTVAAAAHRGITAPEASDKAAEKQAIPPRELALVEHLACEPQAVELVRQYLPLTYFTNPLCRRLAELCLQAAQVNRPLTALLSETDTDEAFAEFAASVMSAPEKIKSEFATTDESVKSLILALRAADLQRKRQALQSQMRTMQQAGHEQAEALRRLEEEYTELGYDLARLKSWDTALPIMEHL